MQENNQGITFKASSAGQGQHLLKFIADKTVWKYKEELGVLYATDPNDIKVVFKGKILTDSSTVGQCKLQGGVAVVVLNKVHKPAAKSLTSKEQTILRTSTGLGTTSPFGFGNYSIVNHPEYMSQISSLADPEKMQEALDDPQAQGLMREIVNDPDTMRQLMEQNPMTKQLMESNPYMKTIMSNPALMKQLFNQETMKKSLDYLKSTGKTTEELIASMSNPNPPNAIFNNANNVLPTPNPYNPMGINNPMMSNLNNLMGMNNPMMNNPMMNNPMINNPMMNNPLLFNNPMYNPMMNGQSGVQNTSPFMNPYFNTNFVTDQVRYSVQLKQLSLMGFTDKQKNISVLKQSGGDLDKAIQKMCTD